MPCGLWIGVGLYVESPSADSEALHRTPDFTIGAVVVAVTAVFTTVDEEEVVSTPTFGVEETVAATLSVEVARFMEPLGGDGKETVGCFWFALVAFGASSEVVIVEIGVGVFAPMTMRPSFVVVVLDTHAPEGRDFM